MADPFAPQIECYRSRGRRAGKLFFFRVEVRQEPDGRVEAESSLCDVIWTDGSAIKPPTQRWFYRADGRLPHFYPEGHEWLDPNRHETTAV